MADIIIGMQFGDEGKGRIVNEISKRYDYIARYQGGANSGHTIYHNGKKYITRIMPSSLYSAHSIIGMGCVIDPVVLINEIKYMGVHPIIDYRCHITLPIYRIWDMYNENRLPLCESNNVGVKVGSTCRGNTGTYMSKLMRMGMRMADILDLDVEDIIMKHMFIEKAFMKMMNINSVEDIVLYGESCSYSQYLSTWYSAINELREENISDTQKKMISLKDSGGLLLLEGAQGALLDINQGSYPDVTSSDCTAHGAIVGTGVPPTHIGKIYGIMKLYVTRVGTGIMPSEVSDTPLGDALCECGNEYGSVTGRKRRVGILDMKSIREIIANNGITDLYITKTDVIERAFDRVGKPIRILNSYDIRSGVVEDKKYMEFHNAVSLMNYIHDIAKVNICGYTNSPEGDIIPYKRYEN